MAPCAEVTCFWKSANAALGGRDVLALALRVLDRRRDLGLQAGEHSFEVGLVVGDDRQVRLRRHDDVHAVAEDHLASHAAQRRARRGLLGQRLQRLDPGQLDGGDVALQRALVRRGQVVGCAVHGGEQRVELRHPCAERRFDALLGLAERGRGAQRVRCRRGRGRGCGRGRDVGGRRCRERSRREGDEHGDDAGRQRGGSQPAAGQPQCLGVLHLRNLLADCSGRSSPCCSCCRGSPTRRQPD